MRTESLLALIDKEYHLSFIEYLYTGVPTVEFQQYMVASSGCQIALQEAAKHNRGFYRLAHAKQP